MSKIVPIRTTIGLPRLEQLRNFVAWEQENNPKKTHIAAWALLEIEMLRELVASLRHFIPHNHDGVDCAGCKLETRVASALPPNIPIKGSASALPS